MKKIARYFFVLVVLSGAASAFADVGGATSKTGGRQNVSLNCQLNSVSSDTMPAVQCAGL